MSNTSPQPRKNDAVLGDRIPTPPHTSILGGIEGVKKRLASTNEQVQIAALEDALNYDKEGLEIVIAALKDDRVALESKAWELLRDRPENRVKKALRHYDSLESTCGISYRNLQRLLAEGQWEEANKETRSLLLSTVNRQDLWLRKGDIGQLPAVDLMTCDRLWVRYSQGHFGFSVQAQILANNTFEDFAKNIGWIVNKDMGGYSGRCNPWVFVDRIYQPWKMPFDLSAPKGYLPLSFELGGGKYKSEPYRDDDSVMGYCSIAGYYKCWSLDSYFGPRMVEDFLGYFCKCSGRFLSQLNIETQKRMSFFNSLFKNNS